MVDSFDGELHRRAEKIALASLPSVRPVFALSEADEHPIPDGTCVFVEVDGQPLVLSVLEGPPNRLLVGLDALYPLTGERLLETLPERPTEDEHLYDVGLVVPDDEFLSYVPRGAFLRLGHLDSRGFSYRDAPSPYLMLGFPSEDTTLNLDRRQFASTPLSLTTREAPAPLVAPISPEHAKYQFLLRMNPEELRAGDGSRDTGPAMFGASGGAIFAIGDSLRSGAPALPIGIATEWWPKDHAVLGTDLRLWIHAFRQARTHLGLTSSSPNPRG